MAYLELLGELPADRGREAARRQVAALAKRRASSARARRAIDVALLPQDRPGDEPDAAPHPTDTMGRTSARAR